MNKVWKVFLLLVILFVIGVFAIPAAYKLGRTTYAWGFGAPKVQQVGQQTNVQTQMLGSCPACPSTTTVVESFNKTDCMNSVFERMAFRRYGVKLDPLIPNNIPMCSKAIGPDNGISNFAPGTVIPYGTITFDLQDRVWVLSNFRVPETANYNTAYVINGQQTIENPVTKEKLSINTALDNPGNIFNSPFWTKTELGYFPDHSRVDFKVCMNFEGDCKLPDNLIYEMTPR